MRCRLLRLEAALVQLLGRFFSFDATAAVADRLGREDAAIEAGDDAAAVGPRRFVTNAKERLSAADAAGGCRRR
uniref:RxLR effector candidate protein n=1 Tax=Hyaloperonospora arabidopsidis (strain Emoy2) TaxID=559515 RepID=M4BW80_HYAAE